MEMTLLNSAVYIMLGLLTVNAFAHLLEFLHLKHQTKTRTGQRNPFTRLYERLETKRRHGVSINLRSEANDVITETVADLSDKCISGYSLAPLIGLIGTMLALSTGLYDYSEDLNKSQLIHSAAIGFGTSLVGAVIASFELLVYRSITAFKNSMQIKMHAHIPALKSSLNTVNKTEKDHADT
ncbi:MotA/TolQ/ExbB proton channel family protein [Maridesulfovibrio zosterae]|uniref:MotA/TolQ/ExbB proton channel family protein n=1 Tax=Maridesulfovibrio zosterae TaxID=82171 RepID=UPI0004099B8D|nr:MotA/TolQ/ExbB proton channel family protein [Maridesulfovibrio zosterae]